MKISVYFYMGSMALHFAMRYYEHSINVAGKMVLGIVKNYLNTGVLEDLLNYFKLSLSQINKVILVRRGRNTAKNVNALENG